MVNINFNVNEFRVRSIDLTNISSVNKWLHQNKCEVNDVWSSFISYYMTDGELFLAIEKKDGCVVGILRGTVEDNNKLFITCFILEEIFDVSLKHHIFEGIVKYAKEIGIDEVFIGISDDDFISKEFWKNKGFIQLRRIERYFNFKDKSNDMLILKK